MEELYRQVKKVFPNGDISIVLKKNHFNDPEFWDKVTGFIEVLRKDPTVLKPLVSKLEDYLDNRGT